MVIKRYETGGGIVVHEGKVLLLDRPKRGEVRLPKGHIDPGETPEMTALRETTEESGYADLQIIAALGCHLVEFDYEDTHYIRNEYYFLMQLTGTQRIKRSKLDEKQFRPIWVPFADAVAKLTFPAEKQVVSLALQVLQTTSP